jgi:hypothetical protein
LELLGVVECVFLVGSAFWLLACIQYLLQVAINRKPPATGSQGALFSRTVRVNGPAKELAPTRRYHC